MLVSPHPPISHRASAGEPGPGHPLTSDLQRPSAPPAGGGAPGAPAPAPSPHLDPPHRILDGRGRGRHLLVHHSPELLLTHVQALWLQLLADEASGSQAGWVDSAPAAPQSLGVRLGQCSFPPRASQQQAPREPLLSPSWKEMQRNWGPRPHRPPPTLAHAPLPASPGPAGGCPAGGSAPGQAGPAAGPAVPAAAPRAPGPGPHTPCRCRSGLRGEGCEGEPWMAQAQPDTRASLQPHPLPRSTTRTTVTHAWGPLTVSRVGGGQVGGGAAVDDGVRSQVRKPSQGHHEAGGVCSGRTHPHAAASERGLVLPPLLVSPKGPSSPAPREQGGGGAGPGPTTTKPQKQEPNQSLWDPRPAGWAPGCAP